MDQEIADFFRRVVEQRERDQRELERRDARLVAADEVEDAEVLDYDDVVPGTPAPPKAGGREHWRFADDIEQSDERMESHLKQVFEHKLGDLKTRGESTHLGSLPGEEAEPRRTAPGGVARDIVRMLRTPQEVRAAIVLSEILQPPQHRW